jgi:tetratricopeptide (TPR) repeat protein
LTIIEKYADIHGLTAYDKGILLAKKGRHTEALDFFDEYLKINPSLEKAWYSKGVSLYNVGDYNAALECFNKTIEINREADYAWYYKGLLLEDLGKNEEARRSYDTSIGINPDYGKEILNKYPIKVMTDEPSSKGFLDFRKYAKSLANIIENSKPRFTVGVFGGWGTGKTTLMLLIGEQLEENKKILLVWFDAWRYEREEYLAVIPFLRTMRLKLEQFTMSNPTETHKWNGVKEGIERTITAFLKGTKLTIGVNDVISAEINFPEVLKSFTGDGSIGNDFNTIYYDAKAFH